MMFPVNGATLVSREQLILWSDATRLAGVDDERKIFSPSEKISKRKNAQSPPGGDLRVETKILYVDNIKNT